MWFASSQTWAAEDRKTGPGAGPLLQSQQKFDLRRLFAPPSKGNPPPRVDNPRVRFDSFLPAAQLGKRIEACRGLAIVALKNEHLNRGWYLGKSYISDEELDNARAAVLSEVSEVNDVTAEFHFAGKIVGADKVVRPQRIVKINGLAAIDELRKHRMVDYVEPYCPNELQLFSLAGCWGTTNDGLLTLPADENGADAREKSAHLASGEWVPWSFRELGVMDAWNYLERKGQVPGRGATVGIVDTGHPEVEDELWSEFAAAKGRVPELDFAPPLVNAFDTCDHGTRMAAFAVAPENGKMMMGVAKGALLFSSRIGDGVVHATIGREEIGFAIERAAAKSQVVTLAWGMPFGSQTITDSIQFAIQETSSVLLAAAGTFVPFGASFFPATLVNETVSVTAIAPKRGSATDFVRLPTGPVWEVAYNPQVDILGIASVDNEAGPSIGLNTGKFSTFGGSSAASAQLAGVFALSAASFRSRYGRLPERSELMDRVLSYAFQGDKLQSETFVNGRSQWVGLGLVNVFSAVGGFMSASVVGDRTQLAGQPFALTAHTVGDGPFTYEWRIAGTPTVISTAETVSVSIPIGETARTFSVAVTENVTGHRRTASVTVSTIPTHDRVLFSRNLVSSFASFLDGQRVDRVLDEGLTTRAGCNVREVLGQEYVKNSNGNVVPFGAPVAQSDSGNRGFSVSRPSGWAGNQQAIPPEGLSAYVHAWHDGLSSVRVRPVYVIDEPAGIDCLTGDLQGTP